MSIIYHLLLKSDPRVLEGIKKLQCKHPKLAEHFHRSDFIPMNRLPSENERAVVFRQRQCRGGSTRRPDLEPAPNSAGSQLESATYWHTNRRRIGTPSRHEIMFLGRFVDQPNHRANFFSTRARDDATQCFGLIAFSVATAIDAGTNRY